MRAPEFIKKALFVLYYAMILSIAVWAIPHLHEAKSGPLSVTRWWQQNVPAGPFRYLGLWQGWSMFAPNPSKLNLGVEAIIEFEDGTFKKYDYPRLAEMGKWEAYKKERHRKYLGNLRKDKNKRTWPRAAQFFREQFDAPDNPVIRVDLVRKWNTVKIPTDPKTPLDVPNHLTWDKSYIFYTWEKN